METDAPDVEAVDVGLDVRGRDGVFPGAHRVLVVVEHGDGDAVSLGERVDERRDRAVAVG